ncbi:hypothetical protein SNE40_003037 [Patella caerulea]|uniref:BTB domain-containing protein n=1 Tax=Patella caerulea TaxID=87958 RepID=A0AAN8Q0F6_PATCE
MSNGSDESLGSTEEIITVREIKQQTPVMTRSAFSVGRDHSDESNSQWSPTRSPTRFSQSTTGNLRGDHPFPPIIPLNVGGVTYMTRLSTLLRYPDSMLAAMFSGRYQIDLDKDNNFFLDSNGAIFGHILEYLRHGTLPPYDMCTLVHRDAMYYGLVELAEQLSLKPEMATIAVREAHRGQFPNYQHVKETVIKVGIENATCNKIGGVVIHAMRTEFKPKVQNFNPKHGCVVEQAHVSVGPWEGLADEEVFIRCLESDLIEEGFNIKSHDGKRKCKYYYGQTCQKFVFRIQFVFD